MLSGYVLYIYITSSGNNTYLITQKILATRSPGLGFHNHSGLLICTKGQQGTINLWDGICQLVKWSGQIISAASHDRFHSPKWWWIVREFPGYFQGNLDWWNIVIWPEWRNLWKECYLVVIFSKYKGYWILWSSSLSKYVKAEIPCGFFRLLVEEIRWITVKAHQ